MVNTRCNVVATVAARVAATFFAKHRRALVYRIHGANVVATVAATGCRKSSGVTTILSQEGYGLHVHEIRKKSQKFVHKYNKLDN